MKNFLLAGPIIIIALMVGVVTLSVVARDVDTLRGGEISPAERHVSPGRYIPILMYHHIRDRSVHEPYSVSPKIFDEQMQWLKSHNYHVIRYADFYQAMSGSSTLPEKSVVITFDDGDRDQYTAAFPILQKYGYSALFYITTNFIGHEHWMDWTILTKMIKAGMEIGGHTLSHPNVAELSEAAARREVEESKKILETHLHIPIQFFAYPGGAHSSLVVELLKNAGYYSAATTRHSVYHPNTENLYLVPRIHIDDDVVSFAEFVRGERR